ncbi:MAG: G-D-S-L family lipolytic protein [Chitinophagaceae bacterium]|nr:G-D-S-L family lipolytic protein [Chitinophagaceae bacterium]
MKHISLFVLSLLAVILVSGQQEKAAYYDEIRELKRQDSLRGFPAKKSILFIGSSSFTMWKDVKDNFPGYSIINHGFGGSTLLDVIHYVNDIVSAAYTRQIIIYCGENDLAAADSVTDVIVAERFKMLFNRLRKKIKNIPIVYISMKPSPSRQMLLGKMRDGNARIRAFLKTQKATSYVDVYKEMIDDEGKPIPELFLDDNLHMNKQGYAIWQKMLAPHLIKEKKLVK